MESAVQQILEGLRQMEKRLTTTMEGGRDAIEQRSDRTLSRCPAFFSFDSFKDTPRYDDDDVFDSSIAPEYDDNVFAHTACMPRGVMQLRLRETSIRSRCVSHLTTTGTWSKTTPPSLSPAAACAG